MTIRTTHKESETALEWVAAERLRLRDRGHTVPLPVVRPFGWGYHVGKYKFGQKVTWFVYAMPDEQAL